MPKQSIVAYRQQIDFQQCATAVPIPSNQFWLIFNGRRRANLDPAPH